MPGVRSLKGCASSQALGGMQATTSPYPHQTVQSTMKTLTVYITRATV